MNYGVIILIIIIIFLFIGGIIIVAIAYNNYVINNKNTNFKEPCGQNINISDLIQLPGGLSPCYQGGQLTNLYYIGELSSGKYDFVVAPFTTQILSICVGYCSSYNQGICNGPNYAGKTAQQNFDECMKLLSGDGTCIPPAPIAALGTTLYYPQSVTARTCCSQSNPDC